MKKKISILLFLFILMGMFPLQVFAAQQPVLVPVLMYHHLSNIKSEQGAIVISPEKFEQDLIAIKSAGYTTMLPGEILNAMEQNKMPPKPLMITFDDGYMSNYVHMYPLLKKYNMKATVFVIGWSIGRNTMPNNITPIIPHFNKWQAGEMVKSGLVSIQPHSFQLHQPANPKENIAHGVSMLEKESVDVYKKRFQTDFEAIRTVIETDIGDKVVAYSYPYGIANPHTEEILFSQGVKMTFLTKPGVSNASLTGMPLMHRLNMPQYLPFSKAAIQIDAWIAEKKNVWVK